MAQTQFDRIAKQAKSRIISWDSIVQALDILNHIRDLQLGISDKLYSTMVSGAVNAYSRNFLNSNGLTPLGKTYKEFDDSELDSVHKLVLRVRNKIFAHQDAKAFDFKVKLRIHDDELEFQPITTEFCSDNICTFIKLIEFQKERLELEIARIIESLDLELDSNNWYEL